MKAPRYFAIIAALLASVVLPGCNSQKASDGSSTGAITITGAGSSFVAPIMERWIADYRNTHPNVQITYQSIGSGGGIQQLKKQLIDFGASDAALSDDQLKDMPVPVVQIAESAGPVCITYNLPDLKQPLKLSSSALAGIFMGTIKKWNDPSIARSNPGVKLPKDDIIVAHRSDGSGTTNIFTNYLATVSPDWAQKVGKGLSLNWPVGVGGKGSEGVTGVVKQSPGGIGYVELSYATQNHLPVAQMQNKAGKWVTPSAQAATAAIASFKTQLDSDL
ncbi:MAG TPA: phosphate ABC transporter substrate-binding protein PstS, partial [Candidatus Limnocylindrales bacterium]|nr:phosphate ABC transporter substrate-binding protein PstS [Candidatus Limnocylindrales bacterium]